MSVNDNGKISPATGGNRFGFRQNASRRQDTRLRERHRGAPTLLNKNDVRFDLASPAFWQGDFDLLEELLNEGIS
jgi:hypothetical protein